MSGYLNKHGNYYEGDGKPGDLPVPKRPTPEHKWNGSTWNIEASDERKQKIEQTEQYANALIEVKDPRFKNSDLVHLLNELWPSLNQAPLAQGIKDVRAIKAYYDAQVVQLNTIPIAQVRLYDPENDLGWPA